MDGYVSRSATESACRSYSGAGGAEGLSPRARWIDGRRLVGEKNTMHREKIRLFRRTGRSVLAVNLAGLRCTLQPQNLENLEDGRVPWITGRREFDLEAEALASQNDEWRSCCRVSWNEKPARNHRRPPLRRGRRHHGGLVLRTCLVATEGRAGTIDRLEVLVVCTPETNVGRAHGKLGEQWPDQPVSPKSDPDVATVKARRRTIAARGIQSSESQLPVFAVCGDDTGTPHSWR